MSARDDIHKARDIAASVFRVLAAPQSNRERALVARAVSFGYSHGFRDGMREIKDQPPDRPNFQMERFGK